MVATLAFYVFASVLLISAAIVVSARNAVHSVLFLILAFFNAAGLFLLAGAEFLAMILVIVYVGAVAVLFLFVVMMLDVKITQVREGVQRYAPIGAALAAVLFAELIFALGSYDIHPAAAPLAPTQALASLTNTEALGSLIYTHYLLVFQLSGLVLLVAMMGAIVLTLRDKPDARRQSITHQIDRAVADTLHVVNMPLGQGVQQIGYFRPLNAPPLVPAPVINHPAVLVHDATTDRDP